MHKLSFFNYICIGLLYHVDFEKRGGCCVVARERHEPQVTIGRTVSKSETTKNIPVFQDLNGTYVRKRFNCFT